MLPQAFSIVNMRPIMQELLDNQIEKMGIESIKKDLTIIKSQLPNIKEELTNLKEDITAVQVSVKKADKEISTLKAKIQTLESDLKKEKDIRLPLECDQRRLNLVCSDLPADLYQQTGPQQKNRITELLEEKLEIQ